MSTIVDQSSWKHIVVTGEDRVRFLNGMVSGNIKGLEEGQWLRTLMLSHKARLLSIFEVKAFPEYLLLSCEASLFENTFATLDKHIVMDDVELEERELPMHSVWESAEDVWTAAPRYEVAPGPSDAEEVEILRVEAGMPRYGVDVDDSNFPFESLLVRLVDYDKGCFTGQEPVARVYARGGGGSKKLLGLMAEGEPLPVGATLSTSEKAQGGQVRSSVLSPRLGAIALAYVHKSAWEPGSQVQVGERSAKVVSLPFSNG